MSRPRFKATTTGEAVIYDLKPKPSEKDMEQAFRKMREIMGTNRVAVVVMRKDGKGFHWGLTGETE